MPRALLVLVVLAACFVPALASAGPQAEAPPTGWLTYAYARPLTVKFWRETEPHSLSAVSELCAQDLASGRQVRVFKPDAAGASGPAWSPDGLQLALTKGYYTGLLGEWRIDLQQNGARTSMPLTSGPYDSEPAWSPDGTTIAFNRMNVDSIQLVDVKTRKVTQLPGNYPIVDSPSWSPDGRRLVFAAEVAGRGTPFQLVVYDFDKRTTTVLTSGSEGGIDPAWSPDGSAIAFAASHGGPYGIDLINADGTGRRTLTHAGQTDWKPAWSPDSRWIAFGRGDDTIHVVSAASGQEHVFEHPIYGSGPAWVPPGTLPLAVDRAPCELRGTPGADRIIGTPYDDLIYAGSGDDVVNGGGGNDFIYGGPGHDKLYGAAGNDGIDGEDAGDRLYGGPGDDVLFGREGDDFVSGGAGRDRISGGEGRDRLYGNLDSDRMSSADGERDLVHGGPGLDTGPVERTRDRVLSVEGR